jgi:hypothetical protein
MNTYGGPSRGAQQEEKGKGDDTERGRGLKYALFTMKIA